MCCFSEKPCSALVVWESRLVFGWVAVWMGSWVLRSLIQSLRWPHPPTGVHSTSNTSVYPRKTKTWFQEHQPGKLQPIGSQQRPQSLRRKGTSTQKDENSSRWQACASFIMLFLTQNSAFGNFFPPKWKLWISNGILCLPSVFSLLFYFLIHYFHLWNLSLWLLYQCNYHSKSFLLFGSEMFNIRQFESFYLYWPHIWESCKMYCEIKCSKIISTFIWLFFFQMSTTAEGA